MLNCVKLSLNNSPDYNHAQCGLNFRSDSFNFLKMSYLYMSFLDDVMSLLFWLRLMLSRNVGLPRATKIGTLRSDNGDVHENFAEKQTSHHFKLFRDNPNSSCYSKEGDFGWS